MKKGLHLSIIERIHQQAAETPDGIALRCGKEAISYQELAVAASRLTTRILSVDDSCPFVGLSASKSPDTIIGMVAIIQSGKAYLPLDREYPTERIAQMVEDSGIKYVVCDNSESEFFAQFGLKTLTVSTADPDGPAAHLTLPGPGELVALLYTSGSTGVPKGVCLTHAGMLNLICHQLQNSKAAKGSHNLLFSHLSFDASFQEIFVSLTSGGTLHIIDEAVRLDAARLLRYIGEQEINRIFIPYVVLQYLTETARNTDYYPRSLVEITTGGELLKITPAIRNFFIHKPDCTLVNVYGPTETSIWVTDLRLSGDASLWPDIPTIGMPIENADIFLLDSEMNEVTPGDVGEIYIGGVNVSKGYLNRDELTRERYFHWVDGNGTSHRLYRTGDLGRVLGNGEIEFHGRADHQVKIRGNRVELGEIEVCLAILPYIAQSVVAAREDIGSTKRLVAYLIAEDGQQHDVSQIREHLTQHLPDYMIPSAFVWLDQFPKTTSGKVDRHSLPIPELTRPNIGVLYRRPKAGNEHKIVELWSELLLIKQIGADDNFFELGGNSLLAQQTIAQLRQRYGLEVGVTQIYQYPTAAGLALAIDNAGALQPEQPTAHKKRDRRGSRAVAIIGMAGRFPGAGSVAELWDILLSGEESVSVFSDEELDNGIPEDLKSDPNYVKVRGIIDQVDEFDAALFGITPTMAKLMDPQQRVFLEICRDVLESSGYLASRNQHSIGVFAGTGNNTYFQNNLQQHPEEIAKVGAFQVMLANEKDYIATRTAYQLDLTGPAVSLNTACSTSLVAISQAVESIRNGQCDMAVAGGVSITVPVKSGHRYEDGAMFSADGHTRTFDAEATGTVFSDGAGVVLLKDLDDAQRDGDTIYAVIRGVGLSNDGGGKGSFMAPSATGQAQAIRMALNDADFSPETIGYIEAHGTATPLGDPIEIEGLKLAFGNVESRQYCRIGSIKSNIGHLTHAAGVAGVIKAALALHHGIIPPTIHYSKPNPNIDFPDTPFLVNDTAFDLEPGQRFRMGVSSFGVGGTNAHIVLETHTSAEKEKGESTAPNGPALITWSAKTTASAQRYAERLGAFLTAGLDLSLPSLSYTLHTTREQLNHRCFVVANDQQELADKLAAQQWQDYTLLEKAGTLAFLFPGQGAQYPTMGRDLYDKEPVYRAAVDHCAEILRKEMDEDIRTVLFTADDESDLLRNTYYTQPALFVTSYALASLFISWGVKPDAFVGHSVGEFVAAHLAGIFSLEDALRLIAVRGRLCQDVSPGGMLSIRAAAEQVTPLLSEGLSIAAINAPRLSVVAGPHEEIERFAATLEASGIACKLLHTSHAFHSSMMLSIREAFQAEISKIALHAPEIPIVSTVTGRWLSAEEATDPVYWANHLVATVRFSEAVMFLQQELSPVYLEAGPGQVTSTLVKQHGPEFGANAFASLYPAKEDEHSILFQALGNLWLRGFEPRWENVYYGHDLRIIQDVPTYAYDRKMYWIGPKETPKLIENNYKQPVHSTMRKDLLISKIKELLEDASGIDISDAPLQSSFIEIGFDSLLLTQVAQSLSRAFDVTVTFRMLNEEYYNLDRLGDYLDSQLPPSAFQPSQPAKEATPSVQPVFNAVTPAFPQVSQQVTGIPQYDTIALISQQISLISQQIALLQGSAVPVTAVQPISQPAAQPTLPNANSVSPTEAPLAPEEVAELKKPFGATARIERQGASLDENQSRYLNDFMKRYVEKTAKSKVYTQEHRSYMADPRVVSGFKPSTKEMTYSIVTNRSKGCRLWDIDGNEYIDALNGFGSNMLGYQPEAITEALHRQIDEGYEIGPQHEKAGEVCKLICELTRMERAALCNTGSEAVLGAMRIARTVTGRSTIVAFSNSYHGIVDEVIVRGTKKLKTFPAAPGIMPEAVQNMLILDYGTPESLQIIRERATELAAVLVEPVQSRRPEFQPVEFVRELRKITAESGTALIFDEVITGFRMHLHGMQHLWGIEADLATYGKVVGSGISIGVIAGQRAFMDALDGGHWEYGNDSVPEIGVTYFAGTFVRHPLALAATKAALEYLKAQGPELQENLTKRTKSLADELNKICQKYRTPMYIAQYGSLWKVKYHQEFAYSELLFAAMRLRGIHILDGFPCFLTTAHTDEDIRQILHVFEGSVHELVKAGFIPTDLEDNADSLPPVPYARLGRDANGNAAWFVQDEKNPGKFLQVVTS
ncbi:hypothetical protein GCM10007415_37230 [Parapedobacter pyrenivorans]|uniref:Amino acid adenylation domain-containing protein n=1 Tax=Parapedobacter pyrenivorans TaxID=1305674 RepID=A0A917I0I2_9SPHI|nr:polyketide synthase [Parapedobacter pyrenivorans]GGG98225.1 hypothetical protein GCM10007415_37230 [Parapedobacter pyrenivorans]